MDESKYKIPKNLPRRVRKELAKDFCLDGLTLSQEARINVLSFCQDMANWGELEGYALFGGQALVTHKPSSRETFDMDIATKTNTVFAAIKKLGYKGHLSSNDHFSKNKYTFKKHGKKGDLSIDLCFIGDNIDKYVLDSEFFERTETIPVYKVPVRVASREDLIVMKTNAPRRRDAEDIVRLLDKDLEVPYLNERLEKYGNKERLKGIHKELEDTLPYREVRRLKGLLPELVY